MLIYLLHKLTNQSYIVTYLIAEIHTISAIVFGERLSRFFHGHF